MLYDVIQFTADYLLISLGVIAAVVCFLWTVADPIFVHRLGKIPFILGFVGYGGVEAFSAMSTMTTNGYFLTLITTIFLMLAGLNHVFFATMFLISDCGEKSRRLFMYTEAAMFIYFLSLVHLSARNYLLFKDLL